jgi:hypothetical protein
MMDSIYVFQILLAQARYYLQRITGTEIPTPFQKPEIITEHLVQVSPLRRAMGEE